MRVACSLLGFSHVFLLVMYGMFRLPALDIPLEMWDPHRNSPPPEGARVLVFIGTWFLKHERKHRGLAALADCSPIPIFVSLSKKEISSLPKPLSFEGWAALYLEPTSPG